MSVNVELNAQLRQDQGKGASRRLRRHNKVPAIVYGADKEPQSITLEHNEIQLSLENEAFYSQIINLQIDGQNEEVILRDVQRHPAKPLILHVDFLRITRGQTLTATIPLHFINEETAPGVKSQGGVVNKVITEADIVCLPRNLPEYIEVDMGELKVDDAIHLSQLQLPEGIELQAATDGKIDADQDSVVVVINKPRSAIEESDAPEAAEDSTDADSSSDD